MTHSEYSDYVRESAAALLAAEEVAYEGVLARVPQTAIPDATQTTYRVVARPPQYTSAIACYSPDVVVEPTVDYGSRLLAALRSARRSTGLGGREESQQLASALAVAGETISADPGAFVVHVLAGMRDTLVTMDRALRALLLTGAEKIGMLVVCVVEGVHPNLVTDVRLWLAGEDEEPLWSDMPLECALYRAQVEQTFDAVVGNAQALYAITQDEAALIDAAIDVVVDLYTFVSAMRLGDRFAHAARDSKQLGGLVGAIAAQVVIEVAARSVRTASIASRRLSAEKLLATSAEALEDAKEVATAAKAAAAVPLDEAAVSGALRTVGERSREILRDAGLSHMESFCRDAGAGIKALAEKTPAPALAAAVAQAMDALKAATDMVFTRVRPHGVNSQVTAAYSAAQRLVVADDAARAVQAGTRTAEEAAAIAQLQIEDIVAESAHLIDKQFVVGKNPPARIRAELALAGLTTADNMPAFAALRATHRTTIERLRKLGADLPDVQGDTITRRMAIAIARKGQAGEGAILAYDDATRGWELVHAHYRVYDSSPLVRHPAWPAMRTEMFEVTKRMLAALRTAEPDLVKRATDAWPEFAAWLAEHPFTGP